MLEALILTILIEIVVLAFLKVKDYKIYMLSIVLNICTNISLNAFLLNYDFQSTWSYVITVVVLEIAVIWIESIGYWFYLKQYKKSLFYATILNVVSFGTGVILNWIFHYDVAIEILRSLFSC